MIWDLWLIVGFAGQFVFAARFIVQWVVSEREKRSHVPVQFWYLSLVGGAITTVYAIHRRDPVFIVGQASGLVVYVRNLMLIHRHVDRDPAPIAPPDRP
jgi:lipid-A-disaccharide synthase-like uncharacterized protein